MQSLGKATEIYHPRFGNIIAIPEPNKSQWDYRDIDPKHSPCYTFRFRYRSKGMFCNDPRFCPAHLRIGMLQAQGIIPLRHQQAEPTSSCNDISSSTLKPSRVPKRKHPSIDRGAATGSGSSECEISMSSVLGMCPALTSPTYRASIEAC